jgi:hypothetical protein
MLEVRGFALQMLSCMEKLTFTSLSTGLGVLFGKLQQGVAENQQVLTIARMRAEAEELYGMKLGDIGPATDRIQGGFGRDDGASVRKVESILLVPMGVCD